MTIYAINNTRAFTTRRQRVVGEVWHEVRNRGRVCVRTHIIQYAHRKTFRTAIAGLELGGLAVGLIVATCVFIPGFSLVEVYVSDIAGAGAGTGWAGWEVGNPDPTCGATGEGIVFAKGDGTL